jgi:solute carrier family 25 protein 16
MKRESSDAPQLTSINSLLYGGIAGCVAKTAIAPFDRVKIHFQIAHPDLHQFRGNNWKVLLHMYICYVYYIGNVHGVFGAVRHIYMNSGIKGLFRSHSATLARIFPYAAINFAAFERFKQSLHAEGCAWRKLIAGSMAGTVAVSVTYPFDIIRARIAYQLSHDPKLSSSSLLEQVIHRLSDEGKAFSFNRLAGFYQGFFPTILGIIPYAGVSFFTFETTKQQIKHVRAKDSLSSGETFVAGLFAGACGQTVAYPLDVLRRRMQLFRITEHLPHAHYSSGMLYAIKSIWKTHGLTRGIFAGLSINYLKVAPASGISFLVYETLKRKYPHGLFVNKNEVSS